MRSAVSIALLVGIGIACSACPKKTDPTPQIEVSPGAAARINLIPSRAGRATPPSKAARVHPMRAGEELGGPNATGKPGDWVLENDEVVFVVDALGSGTGLAESGGNIVDAADAKTRRDELGQVFTYFGTFPRQGVYTAIDTRVEPDGTAVIISRGTELYEPSVEVVTELRLGPHDRALLLRTTLTNKGKAKVSGLGLGDAIQWGGTEKVAPGQPVGFKGRTTSAYVGGVGRFGSYGLTSTEGEISATSGTTWTDTEQKKDVVLEPGASVGYDRVLVVGERPDTASIVSELTLASGGELGAVDVALTDAKGAPVEAVPGSKVYLGTDAAPELLTIVATAVGELQGTVPPGTWTLSYAPSVGRKGDGTRAVVDVKSGQTAKARLVVSDAGSLRLGPCREVATAGAKEGAPLPCKITIEGLGGAATPVFGPAYVAGIAKNVVFLRPSEVVTVPLPHGRYRLSTTRGPEYDLAATDVVVPRADPVTFDLRRVVETPGYVAADFHQHSMVGTDAPVATRDRAIANAAEGVEVAVASEHNAIGNIEPVVKELGLAPWIVELPGVELTTDASKKPFGHANVFPLVPEPTKARNGAPPVRDRLASDVFAEVRGMPGGPHVLQINHPRSGRTGYFDQLGFDPKTGVGTAPGYDATFDALEVWNGRVVEHRERVLDDFFALLRVGRPATPVADTDTHGVVGEEPGYPRTFVRVGASADGSFDGWDVTGSRDLVTALRETRDVVLSNGPFLAVKANGAGIGGVATPGAGAVAVKVTVTTAPWVIVDKVELRSARGTATGAPVVLKTKKNAAGALVGEATFTLRPKEDEAFTVIASGTKPMRPVISGDDAEVAPWAMSGPIWIDVDGDGKALGRTR
jgi:hypothetical protein